MNKPVAEGKDERRYIVYDGDVDAVWVENMNSVMDDNKLLTLPNGERIRLNFPTCSMLFEVFDLQYASPATISRCGMVYVDPKDLGYTPYTYKWLNSRERPEEQEVLRGLFTKYLTVCIDYVVEGIEDKANMVIIDPLRQLPTFAFFGFPGDHLLVSGNQELSSQVGSQWAARRGSLLRVVTRLQCSL